MSSVRLPDASIFEVDWESLAARFRQVTHAPADTRHVEIAPALRFIVGNLIEPLDVDAVVAALPVGRRTLERRFETHLGVSVRRAITLIRLEIARQLLCQTRLTIIEVSVEVGFSSHSQMCNVFRRELSLSPREIRGAGSSDAVEETRRGTNSGAADQPVVSPLDARLPQLAADHPAHDLLSSFLALALSRSDDANLSSFLIIVASGQSPQNLDAPG